MWNTIARKRGISVLLACLIAVSGLSTAFAATVKDVKGHWAASAIQTWVDKGWISGYQDGSFKPNDSISRAELVALINKSFGFAEEKSISYTDAKPSNWFYKDLTVAEGAGYLTVFGGSEIHPNQKATRLEAAEIVAKLASLEPSHSADKLQELGKADEQAKQAVGAAIDAKLMTLDAKGSFRSNDKLTRAEAVVLLTRVLQFKQSHNEVAYDKAGVYGPESGTEVVSKNVVISAPGVTLRNMTIEGNLTIGQAVGDGDVFLKGVTVKGTTSVFGGGANSVHFENSVVVKVVVNKKDGTVRIVVEGLSEVRDVILQSGAKLEESNATGDGFRNVMLSDELPADSKVTLSGKFETVDVLAAKINVEIPHGQVDSLNVDKQSGGVSVNVSKEAKIVDLILAAVTKVIGQGVIEKASIQADGVSIEQTPKTVEVGKDVKAEVGGKPAQNSNEPPVFVPPNNNNPQPSVDKTSLKAAIDSAQTLHDQAIEGNDKGQYRFGVKSELLASIQEAKAVYDNANATQTNVNAALQTLNIEVMIFGYSKNYESIDEAFERTLQNAKLRYYSIPEGENPGNAGAGSKAIFWTALTAANAVIRKEDVSPQEIRSGYEALEVAIEEFVMSFRPNDPTKLRTTIEKADQLLDVAVEAVDPQPGQYRFGAIAFLQNNLQGFRSMLEEYRGAQYELDFSAQYIYKYITEFEADKKTFNAAQLTAVKNRISQFDALPLFRTTASVTGTVYAVAYDEFPETIGDLQSLASVSKAVYASAPTVGSPVDLNMQGLRPGSYKMYHVDFQGQLSKPFLGYTYNPRLATNIVIADSTTGSTLANSIVWIDSPSINVTYTVWRGKAKEDGTAPVFEDRIELVKNIAPGTQSFTDNDPDLKAGTKYFYWVGTETIDGTGVLEEGTITTPTPTP